VEIHLPQLHLKDKMVVEMQIHLPDLLMEQVVAEVLVLLVEMVHLVQEALVEME